MIHSNVFHSIYLNLFILSTVSKIQAFYMQTTNMTLFEFWLKYIYATQMIANLLCTKVFSLKLLCVLIKSSKLKPNKISVTIETLICNFCCFKKKTDAKNLTYRLWMRMTAEILKTKTKQQKQNSWPHMQIKHKYKRAQHTAQRRINIQNEKTCNVENRYNSLLWRCACRITDIHTCVLPVRVSCCFLFNTMWRSLFYPKKKQDRLIHMVWSSSSILVLFVVSFVTIALAHTQKLCIVKNQWCMIVTLIIVLMEILSKCTNLPNAELPMNACSKINKTQQQQRKTKQN